MKYCQFFLVIVPGALLAAHSSVVCAEDYDWNNRDRFSLAYRAGFNLSVNFKNVGATPFANNPSVTGLSYADGFVGTDSTGNAGGLTTRFGYQNVSQAVDGNASLLLHNDAAGTIANDVGNNPYHGFELAWDHELGHGKEVHWGLESALNWSRLEVSRIGVASANTDSVDAFALGFAPPTPTPYVGPVNAAPFTPLLGTTPTTLPVVVDSRFRADFFGLRFGPYIEVPIFRALSLNLSAGLALTVVDGHYDNIESFSTPGGAPVTTSNSKSDTSVIPGGYVSTQLLLKLTEHTKVFAGFQYEGSDSYSLNSGGMRAELDLSGALYATFGASVSF